MIFRVASALFRPGVSRDTDLLVLLRTGALRGHTMWVVDDPEGVETQESSALSVWTDGLSDPLRREVGWLAETLRQVKPHAATRGTTVVMVQERASGISPTKWLRLDLQGAIRFAGLPLFLLVENGLSDAAFLRKALPPAWREKLLSWERDGWVRFSNGGGVDEMTRVVDRFGGEREREPLGLGAESWRTSHVLVCDRDAKTSGTLGTGAAGLSNACGRAQMTARLHILKRRDQEAYLPRGALDTIVASKTDSKDREEARAELDEHFQSGTRHKEQLPKRAWFKNAFLNCKSDDWPDEWFEQDGAWPEMTALAETIASFT